MINITKGVLITLSLLIINTGIVFADSVSHKKAANEFLNTMDIDTLLSQSIEATMQLELKNNPVLRPYESTLRKFYNTYMSGESLREDFIKLYTDTFTEKELNDMNDFYKTSTGQKAIKATPALMVKGAEIGQQRVMENIDQLKIMIEEEASIISNLQK